MRPFRLDGDLTHGRRLIDGGTVWTKAYPVHQVGGFGTDVHVIRCAGWLGR